MHRKLPCCLFLVGLLLVVSPWAPTRATAEERLPHLVAYDQASTHLLEAWTALRERRANDLATVETARAAARKLEREHATDATRWRKAWAQVARVRTRLGEEHDQLMRSWRKQLRIVLLADRSEPLSASARDRVARRCFEILAVRLRHGEPSALFELLRAERGVFEAVSSWLQDVLVRRRLLATLADRHAATPGHSDLDVLCEVVRWDALFLGRLAAGQRQLDALSTDLILIFTERAANGIKLSHSKLYHSRRFSARGFRAELHDGSDQVRHFTWAFRMFVRSKNAEAMEKLLALKERADAKRRKQVLNQADLALNQAARGLVQRILDIPEGAKAATKESRPISGARYAEVLRQALQ